MSFVRMFGTFGRGKQNTVNYVADQVPVPPASGKSIGTQPLIDIRDWGTLVPEESAVAEPDRKWVGGTCNNEWSTTDGGVWQPTEGMLDNEGWMGRDVHQGRTSKMWPSNTWAETEPKGVNAATRNGDGWSSANMSWGTTNKDEWWLKK